MADIAPLSAPATPDPAEQAARARIAKTAKDFEASFLQVMLGQMFETVEQGSFGGGAGEGAFKSFLSDAFAKSMTAQGGIGLSSAVSREMLKMQGLS